MWRRSVLLLVVAAIMVAGIPEAAFAQSPPGAPREVRGLSTDAQGERVTVGWTPPVNAEGVTAYQVQASSDGVRWSSSRVSECEPPSPDQPCTPELTVVFSYSLTVYESYVFRASAYNSAGWGEWSEVSPPFTVLPGNRPRVGAPRDVVVTPILRGLRVAWNPPGDSSDVSYLVEWSRDGRHWQGAGITRVLKLTFSDLPFGSFAVRVRSQRYDVEYSVWATTGPVTVPDRRQRIIDFAGLPTRLLSPGTTVLVPCHLKTNAGKDVSVGVRTKVLSASRGSLDPAIVRTSPCGRVTITLSGAPIKVWVTLAARSTGRYAELFRTKAYRAP